MVVPAAGPLSVREVEGPTTIGDARVIFFVQEIWTVSV
jgi:hypothetical protein